MRPLSWNRAWAGRSVPVDEPLFEGFLWFLFLLLVGLIPLGMVARWISWWSLDAALIVLAVVGIPWTLFTFTGGVGHYLARQSRRER